MFHDLRSYGKQCIAMGKGRGSNVSVKIVILAEEAEKAEWSSVYYGGVQICNSSRGSEFSSVSTHPLEVRYERIWR